MANGQGKVTKKKKDNLIYNRIYISGPEKCSGVGREMRTKYLWGNLKERGRITKATDTHSEYVIFIAFPWQQWLGERASMLRYTCIA
jgi:hypothetical protein